MIALLLLLFAALVPVLLGWRLSIGCPQWTRRRIVLTAAIPVPGCLAVLVAGLAAKMVWIGEADLLLAIVQTVPGLAMATLLFGLGLAFAALGVRFTGRWSSKAGGVNEIFE